jgi:beta-amylase
MLQWGAVERQPRVYDFGGYRAFVRVAKSMGLKLQAVMSFHACGANVGDTAQVPLPDWVLKVRCRPIWQRIQ